MLEELELFEELEMFEKFKLIEELEQFEELVLSMVLKLVATVLLLGHLTPLIDWFTLASVPTCLLYVEQVWDLFTKDRLQSQILAGQNLLVLVIADIMVIVITVQASVGTTDLATH